jgi:hypothetical protein
MRWQENVEQTLTEKKIASIASLTQLVQREKIIVNSVPKRSWMPNSLPRYFSTLGRRLAIVAGSSVLGGVSERISQTRKTRR